MATISNLAARIHQGREYALFLGAGNSISSSIPGAGRVIKMLRRKHHGRSLGHSYSDVMKRAFHRKADRRAFFEELCAGKVPCLHHYQLAELAERQIFKVIYTTNFDRLIETALLFYCSTQPAIYLHDAEFGNPELKDQNAKVIKLHGDFLFEAIANVPTELREKLHFNMRRKLMTNLRNHGLVVLGYGGRDETIMSLLSEAVRDRDCLQAGLWWVEPMHRDQLEPAVASLLSLAKRLGKGGYLLHLDAKGFFGRLCQKLSINNVTKPRFGISANRSFPPVVGAHSLFAHARHALPMPRPHEKSKVEDCILNEVADLCDAIKQPQVLWIVGPSPDAENALGRALAELKTNPVFCFDYHFARNQPPAMNLFSDLLQFASGCGIAVAGQSHNAVLFQLFRKGAVLVFVNTILRQGGFRSDSIQPIFLDPTYLNEIVRILSIHHQASAGKIIFVDRFKPPPLVEADIRVVEVSGNPTQRPQQLSSLTKDDLDLIGQLKFLRFGETPRAIAALTRRAGVRMALERLSASGYLKCQGNRYRLRDELLDELTSRGNAERFLQQKLAKRFEGLSKYALLGHDLNWDHFLLEAEFHYFAAARTYQAAKVLSQMMHKLTALAQTDSASWVAGTLRPFFVIEGSGKRVLSKLPATTRLSFLRVFEMAIEASNITLDDAAQKGLDVVIEHLEEPLKLVYAGEGHSDRGEYLEAIQYFKQAVRLLARRKTSRLLGAAQRQIGACYYSLAVKYGAPLYLDDGKTWTAAAQRTYHKLGERWDEATALDNLGLYYLQRGQDHRRALSFVQRALKILRREPGFSRDKGVVYGNAASAYLKAGKTDLAEGYFLESALHYMSAGDFEGITKLYLSLFKCLRLRPTKEPLTIRRLYETAFYVWGYPQQPSDLLRRDIGVINEYYFGYTLQERDAYGATRAIDHQGYITLNYPPELRLRFTMDRMKQYYDVIGKKAFATVLLPRLRQSAWWSETEKSDLLAYPG